MVKINLVTKPGLDVVQAVLEIQDNYVTTEIFLNKLDLNSLAKQIHQAVMDIDNYDLKLFDQLSPEEQRREVESVETLS